MTIQHNLSYVKLKEKLWNVFQQFDRGDLATYDLISSSIDIEHGKQGWSTVVNAVRRRVLLERGIAMRPETGIGLRFLTNAQQVVVCGKDRTKRIRTQSRNGLNEIQRADSKQLTDHERRLQQFILAGMESIKSNSDSSILDTTVYK